jgi:hypothetical protein
MKPIKTEEQLKKARTKLFEDIKNKVEHLRNEAKSQKDYLKLTLEMLGLLSDILNDIDNIYIRATPTIDNTTKHLEPKKLVWNATELLTKLEEEAKEDLYLIDLKNKGLI